MTNRFIIGRASTSEGRGTSVSPEALAAFRDRVNALPRVYNCPECGRTTLGPYGAVCGPCNELLASLDDPDEELADDPRYWL